jgi:DNA-binding transcriptional regulator LsrR (DeoR family)
LGLRPEILHRKYRNIAAICGYLALDEEGHYIDVPEVGKRMRHTLNYNNLKRMSRSQACKTVLVAATRDKLRPAIAVLKANICNTLIIDEELGEGLLEQLP